MRTATVLEPGDYMAYSDFSLAKVRDSFDLVFDESEDLFSDVEPVEPSDILKVLLADYVPLAGAIATESKCLIREPIKRLEQSMVQ